MLALTEFGRKAAENGSGGTDHGTGGLMLNAQVKAATQELTLAFLQRVFDGDGQGLRRWPERHAGILARFTAEGA